MMASDGIGPHLLGRPSAELFCNGWNYPENSPVEGEKPPKFTVCKAHSAQPAALKALRTWGFAEPSKFKGSMARASPLSI
jgi:hypothetical protein